MKIVFPLINLSMSGGMRVTLQYASGLARRGHQVTLVFPQSASSTYLSLPENLERVSVPMGSRVQHSLGYFATVFALGRAIPNCDVIFASSWQSVYPALVSRRCHPHSRIVFLLQHLDSVINHQRPWPVRFRNRIMYEYVYRLPIQKIAVSTWLRDALQEQYDQSAHWIPNGVNVCDFTGGSVPRWTPPAETYDVLCLGRAAEWKGFHDLAAAMRQVAAADASVRFVVATREQIEFSSDLPVILVRPESDVDLGRLYQSCSVFVFPSWLEGFGLPPLEAMACGAPVVTTDCGGVRDFARAGENCLIVPPRQPDHLAQAIDRIRTHPALARRLSANALETAREFTLGHSVEKLEQVLIKAL